MRIDVRGIVQGVGFRPFIHRLVERHGLTGWVRNSSEGAELELEGPGEELAAFLRELETEAPPLALIVVLAAIPVVVILGVLMALYQRIKQIRGGEEDDAAQY